MDFGLRGRTAIAEHMPELDAQIAEAERHAELAYVHEHIVNVARATIRGASMAGSVAITRSRPTMSA